ncbi:hypothetical protein [Labrys wisconsinensis]|uniref:O-antigen ligase domain-containing protein n=1 Tax=Labrys wisconsinensis TaxID=425677 RepID=A0ABU0JE53_9HYPH|nr:hypothetical protein [Labrys wisconsinensis]MDQ0472550.1 hypothetical protein [Labrys wisconsinensis]
MERRAYEAPLDPALAVSGLLTRLGLFLLVVAVPVLAMLSRRTISVLVPIATVLLILAAALDGRLVAAFGRFGRMLVAPPALALAALVLWAAITILWTPRPGLASTRLLGSVVIIALFAAAVACLKDRAKLSDVNLIPIGVAIAAVALAALFMPHSPFAALIGPDSDSLESQRAAMLLALLAWPAIGSLNSKHRHWQALALGASVALALWLVNNLVVVFAFLAGLLFFLLAIWRPRSSVLAAGSATLALLLLAPFLSWLLANYGGFLLPREGDSLVAAWRDVTYSLPSRLLLGFGFESSGALARGTTGVVLGSPRNAALQVWLELGMVGVALAAVAIGVVFHAIDRVDAKAQPAATAVCAVTVVMMFAGLGTWQSWWVTAVGLAAVSLAFVSRRAQRSWE